MAAPTRAASSDAAAPSDAPTRAPMRPHPTGLPWGRIAGWSVLVVIVLVTLFPFYWMLRTALSNGTSLNTDPTSLAPVDFTWGGFARVLGLASTEQAQAEGGSGTSIDFWGYLGNSVIVSTLRTAGQVLFGALAAYAFARMRWPGRDAVFFLFLTALMIPPIFVQLPNFLLMRDTGLLNTYAGIVAPEVLMTPFAIFFLRQFFLGIPFELEEAARLDGAGRIRTFFQIIVPMSWAPITTLALLQYVQAWNDYFWPLLAGSDESVRTLTVALGIFRAQTPQGQPDWPGLMAAALIAAVPMILLFLAFGRKIVNSIGFSGIK